MCVGECVGESRVCCEADLRVYVRGASLSRISLCLFAEESAVCGCCRYIGMGIVGDFLARVVAG